MYLIHRKIWEFITLVPSSYVQTVQVQKPKKTNRLPNQKLSEILLFWKYRKPKKKQEKKTFTSTVYPLSLSLSLSLSISISPKPSELRALSYLYYDNNNSTQPIIYWRCSI